MAGLNDVVRHVILRLVVDQAGFSAALAQARTELKALEGHEKTSNANRERGYQSVTNAIEANKNALNDNAAANQAHAQASQANSQGVASQWQQATQSIQQATTASKEQARIDRENLAGANKRRQESLNQANKRQIDSENAAYNRRLKFEEGRNNASLKAADQADAQNLRRETKTKESDARVSQAALKNLQQINAAQLKIDDEQKIRDDTRQDRLNTQLHTLAEIRRQATATTDRTQAQSETAYNQRDAAGYTSDRESSRAQNEASRLVTDVSDRRARSIRDQARGVADLNRLSAQTSVIEQRALEIEERRVRAAERFATARRRGIGGAFQSAATLAFADAPTLAGRLVSSAPRRAAQSLREPVESVQQLSTLNDRVGTTGRTASLAERSVARLFSAFNRDGTSAVSVMGRLDNTVKSFFTSLSRSRTGSGSSNLFSGILSSFEGIAGGLTSVLSGANKHLFSFQTLIKAAIVALGPLAAILGAVGAAALGLGSNLVSLVGVLGAVPGLVSAAVGAFGALAIVMKPLSNVFSAYSAAQKEAAENSNSAAEAALNLQKAILSEKQAKLDLARAEQDVPRAQDKLNKARRDAARDIQDYRLQLQKLKYDEEGASLGVESAELAYRKSLVDPTATNLDRRIAKHDVEGALYDQRDQQVSEKRLKEDSKDAFAKGVEGADGVVDAVRAAEDATNDLATAEINYKLAVIATQKARLADAAGGDAAAKYKAELEKLPPMTRKVAEAIIALQKSYGALRDRLSEKIFGPLSKDTDSFKTVLSELEAFLSPAADALGKLADSALKMFTNPDWKKFFSSQGDANGRIISGLGTALLDFADGMRSLIETAQPFTDFVVGGIKGLAASFKDFSTSDEGRKKVASFLDIVKTRFQELKPIIGDFVAGFAGFFTALNKPENGKEDFTTRFNKGLGGVATTFRKLGEEAAKPGSGFRKWLDDVIPLLKQVGGFVGEVGKFFGKLFSDPDNLKEAETLLHTLATKWLPQLSDIFDKLSQSQFISKLAAGLGSAFEGINKFLDGGGIEAFKSFTKYLEYAGKAFATVIGFFSSLPGVVQGVGTVIAAVFGAALIAKFSGITLVLKGVLGLFRLLRNALKDIPDPNNASKAQQSRKTTKTGTPGAGTGGTGSPQQQSTRSRTSRRLFGNPVSDAVPNQYTKQSQASQTRDRQWEAGQRQDSEEAVNRPTTVRQRFRNLFRNDTGSAPVPAGSATAAGSTRPSRSRRLVTGLANQAKDSVTGDSTQSSVLRRIEAHARQIEINTRRSRTGGTAASSKETTRGGATRTTTATRPGTTGTTARPGTTGTQISDIGARPYSGDIETNKPTDPTNRTAEQQRAARNAAIVSGSAAPARPSPTGTLSDTDLAAANARRAKVGLPPIVQNTPKQTGINRTSIGGADPLTTNPASYTVPATPGSAYDKDQRTRAATNSRRERLGLDPLSPTDPIPDRRTQSTQEHNSPVSRNQRYEAVQQSRNNRLNNGTIPRLDLDPATTRRQEIDRRFDAVAASQARRTGGGGTIPRLDYDPPVVAGVDTDRQPNNRRSATTETAAQKRKRLAAERAAARNAQVANRRTTSTAPVVDLDDDDEDDTPAKQAKRKNSVPDRPILPSPGGITDRPYTVPTAEEVGTSKPPVTRGAGGRITSPYAGAANPTLGFPAPNFPGQAPTKEQTKRNRQTRNKLGQFGSRQTPTRIGSGKPSRPKLGSVLGNRLKNVFASGDEGSFGYFGLLDKDDTKTSSSSRRTSSVTLGGDDEYEDGYEDGLRAGGGGSGLDTPDGDRKQTRKERRQERKQARQDRRSSRRSSRGRGGRASLAGGLLDDVLDNDSFDDDSGSQRRRRSLDTDDDGGRSSRRGGSSEGRRGGRLGRLGGRVGGGLASGVLGGVAGLAISGGLQMGGETLINKYVKNDKDASSLQRGLGAVSNGVGIGSTIGSLIPIPGGAAIGGLVGGAVGGIYSLFKDKNLREFVGEKLGKVGHTIAEGFGKAASAVGGWISKAGKAVGDFFTKKIPGWAEKAASWILDKFLAILKFWYVDLPLTVFRFLTKTLPGYVETAVMWILDKFLALAKFWYVDLPKAVWNFVTGIASSAFTALQGLFNTYVGQPLLNFFKGIPKFVTDTVPHWFSSVGEWFGKHVISPISTFFTDTLPKFFTETLPNALRAVPGLLYDKLVKPVTEFFSGLKAHISITDLFTGGAAKLWDWAKSLFTGDSKGKMSGGLIEGVFQGIEDKALTPTTPGEFVVRRSKVQEPGAKSFLADFNDGRIKMSDLYGGLSASSAPQVMSMVPPDAQALTNRVPTVVNTTINHAPVMGDVTIHNPVRERSEHSLRRQVQIANIRHRR